MRKDRPDAPRPIRLPDAFVPLSIALSLPVPLGNLMPSAAICVIALALLERDGLWVLIGLATTVAAFAWVGGMAYALIKSALFVVMNAFFIFPPEKWVQWFYTKDDKD